MGECAPNDTRPSRFTSAVPWLSVALVVDVRLREGVKQRIVGRSTPRLRSAEAVAAVGRCVVRAVSPRCSRGWHPPRLQCLRGLARLTEVARVYSLESARCAPSQAERMPIRATTRRLEAGRPSLARTCRFAFLGTMCYREGGRLHPAVHPQRPR